MGKKAKGKFCYAKLTSLRKNGEIRIYFSHEIGSLQVQFTLQLHGKIGKKIAPKNLKKPIPTNYNLAELYLFVVNIIHRYINT